ncbi:MULTISPECIES: COG4315 family predicted lipoprotein [Cupriavidus]
MVRSRLFAVPALTSLSRPAALAFACSAVLLSACSGLGGMSGPGNMPPTVKVANGALTDPQGLTLYTFDRDSGDKSACNGGCATNWPPLLASPGTSAMGSYTIITRDDGAKQWAYRGKPLYRFAKDAKPGDRTGDNINNVWHVATP